MSFVTSCHCYELPFVAIPNFWSTRDCIANFIHELQLNQAFINTVCGDKLTINF